MESEKKSNKSSDAGAFEEASEDTLREINLLRDKLIYTQEEWNKLNNLNKEEEKKEGEENKPKEGEESQKKEGEGEVEEKKNEDEIKKE